jgi:tetratricopeptide (TPR) repeat protein
MIYYYYAEIHKMFQEYQEAIEFYSKSIHYFREYANKKRKERENAKGSISLIGYSLIQSKGDIHELSCQVKIIECRAKIKDFTFEAELKKLISSIEREIREITKASEEDDKQQDKAKTSQLENLLAFCKRIGEILEKRKMKDPQMREVNVSNIGEIQGASLMVREIKKN